MMPKGAKVWQRMWWWSRGSVRALELEEVPGGEGVALTWVAAWDGSLAACAAGAA
jgi:hypothetical protein